MTDHRFETESQRILIVEDAADTRLLLNLRLQREGYQVLTASNGSEALALVQSTGLPNLVDRKSVV